MKFLSKVLAILRRPIGSPKPPKSGEVEENAVEESPAEGKAAALPKRRLRDLLYYIAAFFMPSILLFDLYSRNLLQNRLIFRHILILASILAVAGVLVYIVFKVTTKNAEGALLLCILFWVFFWLFEAILGSAVVPRFITSTWLIIILVIVLAVLAVLVRRYKPPLNKALPVFRVLSLCLVGLFGINLFPGLSHEITLARARADDSLERGLYFVKRDFYIDETLPSPDILWIHVDGMMSMETVERFFGASQDNLREELALRGFVWAPNTELNASTTIVALPALLSPAFYDNFFGERLASVDNLLLAPRVSFLIDELAQIGMTFWDKFLYFEILRAFNDRGYSYEEITTVPSFLPGFGHDEERHFLSDVGDLPRLLDMTTPLNVAPFVERIVSSAQQQGHERDYKSLARFIWIELLYTHMELMQYVISPELIGDAAGDPTAVNIYPLAYAKMADRMLYYVDAFLEENPDTVIILQADHGFHMYETQLFLLDQGYSLDQVLELMHSVFSAVRIPEKYGGLDAPLDPLNITRELVNRFVGENYTLLP